MTRRHGKDIYTTTQFSERDAGSAGVELYCETNGRQKPVARVVFLDAAGQFYLEVQGIGIPLNVVEELIAESKQAIKIK